MKKSRQAKFSPGVLVVYSGWHAERESVIRGSFGIILFVAHSAGRRERAVVLFGQKKSRWLSCRDLTTLQ